MNKFRTVSFWMSLCGAVVILLTTLGIRIDADYVNEVVTALSGVLVLLGVLTAPDGSQTPAKVDENSATKEVDDNSDAKDVGEI